MQGVRAMLVWALSVALLANALEPPKFKRRAGFERELLRRKLEKAKEERRQHELHEQYRRFSEAPPILDKRQSRFSNANTTSYAVNSSALPDVTFDAGESYAGQLPIGTNLADGNLFFWFWPTTVAGEPKEIVIWLNGGPGCSSFDGFFKENGPILWPTGAIKPRPNPWSWHHLSNVVWIEQPIGTGFSTGPITIQNEDQLAKQFMGFWKNFVDLFGLHDYKIYITGESYAGMYCPYIASNMLAANDKRYFDVQGMSIYDPVISVDVIGEQIPAMSTVELWRPAFPFNDTTMAMLRNMSRTCGYDAYMDKFLTFPPSGPQPHADALPGVEAVLGWASLVNSDCAVWDAVLEASLEINPGFNLYQITQLLPVPDDVLGFPYSDMYLAPGIQVYFNRPEVKRVIHAPLDVNWEICASGRVFAGRFDQSPPTGERAIPHVIEATNNVIISHGTHDWVLIMGGTLLAIQNMTWNGAMGFQAMPESPFFVPHHPNPDVGSASGHGVMGTTHTERGLTWCVVTLAGHMVPTFQAAAAWRQMEFLLHRVDSLSSTTPLSLYPNWSQPSVQSLGGGSAPVLGRLLNGSSTSDRSCPTTTPANPAASSARTPSSIIIHAVALFTALVASVLFL